jgi:quinol monooxygenase YgiN
VPVSRRTFSRTTAAAALGLAAPAHAAPQTSTPMYGLIGKFTAVAGQRDALAAVLLGGTGSMPGCLSYIVARDATDADTLWITEVWDSEASHKASLSLPSVREAIAKGRPLIASIGSHVVTTPLGGIGLK